MRDADFDERMAWLGCILCRLGAAFGRDDPGAFDALLAALDPVDIDPGRVAEWVTDHNAGRRCSVQPSPILKPKG